MVEQTPPHLVARGISEQEATEATDGLRLEEILSNSPSALLCLQLKYHGEKKHRP